MPGPLVLPMAIAALNALSQYKTGIDQKQMAKELKPSNYIPPAIREAEAAARLDANATVTPGYGRTLDKLKTSSANSISNAERGGNPNMVQQTVANTDAREKEIIKDLGVANEENRLRGRERLGRVLGVKGQYEQKSQDAYNAAVSALTGASMQNKQRAFSGLAESAITLYGTKAYTDAIAGVTPTGKAPKTPGTTPPPAPPIGVPADSVSKEPSAPSLTNSLDDAALEFNFPKMKKMFSGLPTYKR